MRKANTGFPQICLGISKWLWGVVCNRGIYGDMVKVMYCVAEIAEIHILFWSNLELLIPVSITVHRNLGYKVIEYT